MLNSLSKDISNNKIDEVVKSHQYTNCSNCAFFEDNKCKLNRIEKFKFHNRLRIVDNKPMIDGVCNTYRDLEWSKFHKIDPVTDVKKETKTTFNICVLYSEGQNLKAALESVVQQNYYPIIQVIVAPEKIPINSTGLFVTLKSVLAPHNIPYKLILDKDGPEVGLDQFLFNQKPKPFYYFFMSADNTISPNMLSELDYRRNYDLEKIGACLCDENNFIMQSTLYWTIQVKHFREMVPFLRENYAGNDMIREFTF